MFSLKAETDAPPSNPPPFKRIQNGFKYLGIEITRTLSTAFTKNFTALLNSRKHRWASLPLSGRVNLIKMIVLLKFLCLFQNVTILIKKSFFKTLDKIVISLIWGNKPSGISKLHLQRPKHSGVPALPNFLFLSLGMQLSEMNPLA